MDLRIMKLPCEGFIKYNSRYMDCALYSSGVLWVAKTAGLYRIILNRKTEMLNSVKNVSSTVFFGLCKNCERSKYI